MIHTDGRPTIAMRESDGPIAAEARAIKSGSASTSSAAGMAHQLKLKPTTK